MGLLGQVGKYYLHKKVILHKIFIISLHRLCGGKKFTSTSSYPLNHVIEDASSKVYFNPNINKVSGGHHFRHKSTREDHGDKRRFHSRNEESRSVIRNKGILSSSSSPIISSSFVFPETASRQKLTLMIRSRASSRQLQIRRMQERGSSSVASAVVVVYTDFGEVSGSNNQLRTCKRRRRNSCCF